MKGLSTFPELMPIKIRIGDLHETGLCRSGQQFLGQSAFVRTHLAWFRKDKCAPIPVIALSPPVPIHWGGRRARQASSRALSHGCAEIAWFLLARRYHGGSPKTVRSRPLPSSPAPETARGVGKTLIVIPEA